MNFNEPLFTYLHVFTVFIPWTVKKIYSQCLLSSCEMRLKRLNLYICLTLVYIYSQLFYLILLLLHFTC